MPKLITGIGFHACPQPCACNISVFKTWDPDAPPRPLDLYARQLDKWMKIWGNVLNCSKLDSTKPVVLLPLLLLHLLDCVWKSSWFICTWAYGLVVSMRTRGFLLQSLATFGKNITEVGSKYVRVHAYNPMLTSSSCRTRPKTEPLSQTAYYLSSRPIHPSPSLSTQSR